MQKDRNEWPDTFDFNSDPVCQDLFLPFIQKQLKTLRRYDKERPDDITYVFHEHAERVADNVRKTCLYIGLEKTIANNMYWAVLPHDIGKARLPVDVWDTEEKPSEPLKKFRRTHTLLGAQMVQEYFPDTEHPFKSLMTDIMRYHHEQMDGKGTHEISGKELSLPVRLTSIVEAYDGWRIWRPHFADRDISPLAVIKRMRTEKLHMFDENLFEAFEAMKIHENKLGL